MNVALAASVVLAIAGDRADVVVRIDIFGFVFGIRYAFMIFLLI
jgi:hypothetical protein